MSSPAQSAPRTSVPTRIAAVAVAATALAGLSATGGLRGELVAIAVAASALIELLNDRRSARTEAMLRTYLLPVALLVCAGPAIPALVSAGGDPEVVRSAGARLAAGALVVLPLAGAARRDLLTRLALATATAGLAASGAASEVVLPGLLFGIAAAALLALLERDRLADAAATSPATAAARVPTLPLRAGLVPGASVLLVVGLITALLTRDVQLTPRNLGGSDAGASSGGDSANGGDASPRGQNDRLQADSGFMDLRQRGSLPKTPVAQVATADELLWRSTVLTTYTGRYWRAEGETDSGGASRGRQRSDQVTLLDRGSRLLLSPGRPATIQPYVGSPVGYGGAWRMPLGPYTVTSTASDFDPSDPTELLAPASEESTLQLPQLPARVLDLAQRLTAGATTRAAAVTSVVDYLRANYTYRLNTPPPAQKADAVDDFLFTTREGFCEQFASAAAVLLRAVGVPTRMVVGYASGEPNAQGRLLRGDDAHAWIEVEFEGRGWADVDPTAGTRLTPDDRSALGSWLSEHGFGAAGLAVLGLLVGVALGLAVALVRRREAALDPLDRGLRVLDRRLGSDRRRPDETLREFAARLGLEGQEAAALGVVERARYAPRGPAVAERRAAAAALSGRRRRPRRRGRRRPSGLAQ